MTDDLDDLLADTIAEVRTAMTTATERKCKRHQWAPPMAELDQNDWYCLRCRAIKDEAGSRRSRNNRKRGTAAELTVARAVGGRKVGPLNHPWDVEMPGYARIQVRKYQTPQGLRKIAAELARIARAPGPEMPAYLWVEPGRGGEQLIVFRAKDFAERHGTPTDEEEAA